MLFRKDDPVLGHSRFLVELAFCFKIMIRIGRGKNFHQKIGCPFDLRRRHDVLVLDRHDNQIGLYDIVVGKLEIYRRVDDLALSGQLYLGVKLKLNVT